MAIVEPRPPLYSVEDIGHVLAITIRRRRAWGAIAFLCFWLVGWVVGEVVAITVLLGGGRGIGNPAGIGERFFIGAWLGVWTLGGVAAMYCVLAMLVGREILTIDDEFLSIDRRAGPFRKLRQYRLSEVSRLRPASRDAQFGPTRIWRDAPTSEACALCFDYGAKTVGLAAGIDQAEGVQILAEIARRFDNLIA